MSDQFDLVVKPAAGSIASNIADLEAWVNSVRRYLFFTTCRKLTEKKFLRSKKIFREHYPIIICSGSLVIAGGRRVSENTSTSV